VYSVATYFAIFFYFEQTAGQQKCKMRAALVFVFLAVIAVSTALQHDRAKRSFMKKTVMMSRALTAQCQQNAQPCVNSFQNNMPSVHDAQFEQKVCRVLKTFYDCIQAATFGCHDEALQSAMQELLQEGQNACPSEFGRLG